MKQRLRWWAILAWMFVTNYLVIDAGRRWAVAQWGDLGILALIPFSMVAGAMAAVLGRVTGEAERFKAKSERLEATLKEGNAAIETANTIIREHGPRALINIHIQ